MTTASAATPAPSHLLRTSAFTVGGLVCFVLLMGFVATAWFARSQQLRDTERATQNLALVLDEHAQKTFRVIDLTLQAAAQGLEPLLGTDLALKEPELTAALKAAMVGSKEILNLSVIGPDGRHIVDIVGTQGHADYSDRPYYSVLRDRRGSSVFISDPFLARSGRGWIFAASRRLDRPDGSFAGAVVASVALDHFLKFYGTLAIGDDDEITLRNRDGIVFVRHPQNMDLVGKAGPSFGVVEATRDGGSSGTLTLVSPLGVTTRIVSFRAVEGTPFVVSVAAGGAVVTEGWLRDTVRYALLTLALIGIIAALIWGVTWQIARRGRADQAARESEVAAVRGSLRLADAIEALPSAFLLFDADNQLIMVNRALAKMFPPLAAHFVTGAFVRFGELLRMAEGLGIIAGVPTEEWTESPSVPGEFKIANGEFKTTSGQWIQSTIWLTSDGGRVEVYLDITERKQALDVLVQVQKMDSIGQLTGGVAHDFNNLLTVILGNSSLLVENLDAIPALRGLAQMIEESARRGAALTHRLLAFARQQPLQPAGVDLNALVTGMEDLLRRTLGEDIVIVVSLAKSLSPILADASQVENALLNLVVNSRDAMPDGGTLTIETAATVLDADYAAREGEVEPGSYAVLAVTDTGTGMTAEVQRKVFEPFFTTKDVDKGTGLGLSMVFGFAKQSGGHVKIYSELGVGTAVRLYLPWAGEQELEVSVATEPVDAAPCGGETILVVEDDELVRSLAMLSLRTLGYAVHAARSGPEALALLATVGHVDLLFTDIGLPLGMNGSQLADEARRRRPGLRVLFTSGYSAEAVVHRGRLDPGVRLLSKPYRKEDLARHVRAALVTEPPAGVKDELVMAEGGWLPS